MVQRLHDEHIIKIGCHRLLLRDWAGIPAQKGSFPGQGGQNPAVAVFNVVDGHEISHGGERFALLIIFLCFQPGIALTKVPGDAVALPVDRDDPGHGAGLFSCKSIIVNIQCDFLHFQMFDNRTCYFS